MPVSLKAGQDYMLVAEGDLRLPAGGNVPLTAPGGSVVASAYAAPDTMDGTEFRARYSAVYTMHVASGSGSVAPDCRGMIITLCHIALNHTKHSRFNAGYDSDWWRMRLLAGRTYQLTVGSDAFPDVSLRDARGRILALPNV